MTAPHKPFFRTDRPTNTAALRASSGVMTAVANIARAIEGVEDVLVLHRDGERSKFFFVLDESSADRVGAVVQVMLQIEGAFPGERVDYDTISKASIPLVPDSARSLIS